MFPACFLVMDRKWKFSAISLFFKSYKLPFSPWDLVCCLLACGVSNVKMINTKLLLCSIKAGLPDVREQTLIAVKPDGVQRRLIGQIIQRFEQRGFKLVGLKMMQVSEDLLSQHYCGLKTKPFYPSLLHYMTSGPVVAMVWEGPNVVQTSRAMVGHTNPAEAPAGTVRGDFSIHISRNVVHASDSLEGAQREIKLWFQGKELLDWNCSDQKSLTEM
ncbi:nucleoside diphosphate kinase, mitochondrial [Pholidichthys leucotaenia]